MGLFTMELSRRDLLILVASLTIILVILLPSLIINPGNADDLEEKVNLRSKVNEEDNRYSYLVSDPVHAKESTDQEFWFQDAQEKLRRDRNILAVNKKAKNVIFFLSDGMGISTQTAARTLKGQRANLVGGEQAKLSFEEFPNVALSRTYCYDNTVADSACSATAYLGGVKANKDTIGVSAVVKYEDCQAQLDKETEVDSLLAWAQEAGKATGIVTTDSLTGASPAGTFAHTASRDWENDRETPEGCEDIAKQLIRNTPGKEFDVILGGGGKHFNNENNDCEGRSDGLDLIQEWKENKKLLGKNFKYVTNLTELKEINSSNTDQILGIFNDDKFEYDLDLTENDDQPDLEDMTRKAIEILSKNTDGFVLFVEAAHVDKAHHDNWARKALEEVLRLDEAVSAALNMSDLEDTLIIVTADHSHALTINGYPTRGTDIFGYDGTTDDQLSDEGHYYPTLMYSTGPGHKPEGYDVAKDRDVASKDHTAPSTVMLDTASHQGEDVAVWAVGPQAHLIKGLIQQNYIPHVLAYAACIGKGDKFC